MTRHHFKTEQWLPYPVEDVFRFFSDPGNLPRLMPQWQHARLEELRRVAPPPSESENPVAVGAGSRILMSFRPFPFSPVRLRWDAEIADFAWNSHFSDLQRKGPFAYWLHRHSVQPSTSNEPSGREIQGTLLRDEVTYEVPFGPLGNLANQLFIRKQLRSTFAYRHARTAELLSPRSHSS
jgi:ligand-binding SRPBCC domain-containing protein